MAVERRYWEDMEPHQLEDIFQEDDVPLRPLGKRITRLLIWGGLVILSVFVVLASTVRIPRYVHLPVRLEGGGPEQRISYPEPITLHAQWVALGDTVQAGDPLLTLSSPQLTERVFQFRTAETNWARFQEEGYRLYRQQLSDLVQQQTRSRVEVAATQRDLRTYRQVSDSAAQALGDQSRAMSRIAQRNQVLNDQEVIADVILDEALLRAANQRA
ncbi:MAG TPA: hypothetical protein DCE41_27990, partial [Cytophagales bacterium]|nr:hypothetical protein [Cytophagales bacterium]